MCLCDDLTKGIRAFKPESDREVGRPYVIRRHAHFPEREIAELFHLNKKQLTFIFYNSINCSLF